MFMKTRKGKTSAGFYYSGYSATELRTAKGDGRSDRLSAIAMGKKICYNHTMIPESNNQKSDAGLLAGKYLIVGLFRYQRGK